MFHRVYIGPAIDHHGLLAAANVPAFTGVPIDLPGFVENGAVICDYFRGAMAIAEVVLINEDK